MQSLVEYIYYNFNTKYQFDYLDECLLKHLYIEHAYKNQYSINGYYTFESLGLFKDCKIIVNYIIDNIKDLYKQETNIKIDSSKISNNLFFDNINLYFSKNIKDVIEGQYKIGYKNDDDNEEYDLKKWNINNQKFNFIDIIIYNFDDPRSEWQVDDLAEILTHELTHAWDDYILHKEGNSSLRNKKLSNNFNKELKEINDKLLLDSIFKFDKNERDLYKTYLDKDMPLLKKIIYYLEKTEQNAYISQLNQILKNKKFEETKDLVKYLNDKCVTYYNYKTIFELFHNEEYINKLIELGLKKSSINKLKKKSHEAWNKIVNHLYHILEDHKAKSLNEGSSKIFLRDLKIKLYKRQSIKVLTLTTPDIENGFGCRVTIWFAGCNRRCPGCHNPHTWAYNQGKELLSEEVLNKIYSLVDKDYIQGITLSGGDPFDQDENSLKELLIFIKHFKINYPDKDIWIYSGGLYEDFITNDIIREILIWSDVLVDGPFKQELKELDLPFKGSTNQRIIDLKKSLFTNTIVEIPV